MGVWCRCCGTPRDGCGRHSRLVIPQNTSIACCYSLAKRSSTIRTSPLVAHPLTPSDGIGGRHRHSSLPSPGSSMPDCVHISSSHVPNAQMRWLG
jgi:hypothetical protein